MKVSDKTGDGFVNNMLLKITDAPLFFLICHRLIFVIPSIKKYILKNYKRQFHTDTTHKIF